jgi:uncharacterized protein YhbP (UPF0306 family)
MQDRTEKARDMIRVNRYMTLATSDGESVWIAPIAYVVDTYYNFYWYSAVDARHSQHIQYNSQVAVAIYNSTEPSDIISGLQMPGNAYAVEGPELAQIMDLYWRLSFPDESVRLRWTRPIGDFTGAAIQRFYQFTPTNVYMPDPSDKKVDRRMEVNLTDLRRLPPRS